jgi:hypothetical protein
MAFCRQHGVAYQTFIAWLRKRASESAKLLRLMVRLPLPR